MAVVTINKRAYAIRERQQFDGWERVQLTSMSGSLKSAIFVNGEFDCWEGGKDTRKQTMTGRNRRTINWRG